MAELLVGVPCLLVLGLLEVLYSLTDTLVDRELGVPTKIPLSPPDIRSSPLGVVLGRWQTHNFDIGINLVPDHLCKLADSVLLGVAQVDRFLVVPVHQQDQSIHQVVDILERSRLLSIAIDRQLIASQGLHDKVADHSAIVFVHPGSKCVEDPGNPDVDFVLLHVRVSQGLGNALSFVVAGSWSNWVDVAPICLLLRMFLRISVHL